MNRWRKQSDADPRRRSLLQAIIGAPLLAAMPTAAAANASRQRWEDALIDFAKATKSLAIHPETILLANSKSSNFNGFRSERPSGTTK